MAMNWYPKAVNPPPAAPPFPAAVAEQAELRDRFAAAALSGLLGQPDDGTYDQEWHCRAAYSWADSMLRERARSYLKNDEKRTVSHTDGASAWLVEARGGVAVFLLQEDAESFRASGASITPLYRSQALTEEEMHAIEVCISDIRHTDVQATLRGLLKRLL